MAKVVVHMVHVKDTKGTYVYNEVDAKGNAVERIDSNVPQLYIQKSITKTPPDKLTLTLEW